MRIEIGLNAESLIISEKQQVPSVSAAQQVDLIRLFGQNLSVRVNGAQPDSRVQAATKASCRKLFTRDYSLVSAARLGVTC